MVARECDTRPNQHRTDTTMSEFTPDTFIADLVQASYNQYAGSTQRLIASLQRSAARQRAEKELIRERIEDLLNSPYAPSGSALLKSLYPPDALIEKRAAEYTESTD
jgi:hypothetical protein